MPHDLAVTHLSFWTDNGAYYYGDRWHEAGGGGRVVNEQAIATVADRLEAQGLREAVRLWQLDDWWYPGTHAIMVHCVHNWTINGRPHSVPRSLREMSGALRMAWLLYLPFFCPHNVY